MEMKRLQGGVVSQHQKDWIEALNNINSEVIEAVVCRGFEEAVNKIESELKK